MHLETAKLKVRAESGQNRNAVASGWCSASLRQRIVAYFHVDSGYSWVWFAPQGCSIQAINRDGESENIVGLKTLTDATTPQVDADLKLVMNDAGTGNMLHNIDKISFGTDCVDYYAAFALTSAASLQKAAEGGADVAVMIALLEQVAAALGA